MRNRAWIFIFFLTRATKPLAGTPGAPIFFSNVWTVIWNLSGERLLNS
jgi:hypothetical protein